MRLRPETSTSERQLVLALAAGGRNISLEELAGWRKDGLLPPLASHGIRAAGRCYYWREPDIQAQAETVYDSLKKHGRNDAAAIGLWLRGFEVSLPRLRRAWLHRSKRSEPARIRRLTGKTQTIRTPANGLSDLLLCACRCTAASIESPLASTKSALAVLERAVAELGLASKNPAETEAHWRMAMALLALLDSSDVLVAASDDNMREAQRHLQTALTFLSDFRGNESNEDLIDSLGPPIFLLMVTLLRSGQRSVLEAVTDRIAVRREQGAERGDRPYTVMVDRTANL